RFCARGASRPTTPSPWACTAGCPWSQLSTETGRRPSRTPSVRWAACGESPQRSKEEEDDCWPGRSIEALAWVTVVMEFVADVGVMTTVVAVTSASAEGAAVTSGTVTVSRLWCLRNALSLLRRFGRRSWWKCWTVCSPWQGETARGTQNYTGRGSFSPSGWLACWGCVAAAL
ncbi:unnamed protein product, partial [Ectocarpus fasciculatus]